MHTARITPHSAMLLLLIALASTAAAVAGLGVIHYLHGNMVPASISLAVPGYLAYWAWRDRDAPGSALPLISLFLFTWLAGLPIGWAVSFLTA